MINVSPEQLKIVLEILQKHSPDCEVRVFGSRFTGTPKTYSDLDLAVVGERKLEWRQLAELKDAFEDSNLPFRVDLLDWHAISPEFKKIIEQGYEIIYPL